MSEKDIILLKKLESERIEELIAKANSEKSEEKLA